MLKIIDNLLNKTTKYRLVIYYLASLLGVAFILSFFGNFGFSPVALFVSTAILLLACWGINRAFARIFKVPVNHESSIITALILALIITPSLDQYSIGFLLAASGLAMASKYVFTIKGMHIFNPAAIAVALTAIGPQQYASWWVGTAVMLPFVIAGGLLVIRKIRHWGTVLTFFASTFIATALFAWLANTNVLTALQQAALTSPVFFLGFVMLTEPLTSPKNKKKRLWFAGLVGVLLPPQVHLFNFYTSPEIALVIGNIFAYIINPRSRMYPTLIEKYKIAENSYDFVFNPGGRLAYKPGQYMEWTLPHKGVDARGNRRYFTLASSPTEPTLRLGTKFYEPSSSYKKALLDITKDTPIAVTQASGDFVLPRDKNRKLVFIAGGIGVTPFRSMTKYLLDTHEQRDVTMLYAANTMQDIAYMDVFEQARHELAMTTTYVIAKPDTTQTVDTPQADEGLKEHIRTGFVDIDALRATVKDFQNSTFYISGSHAMVNAIEKALKELGVKKRYIRKDYFPGYL